MIIEIPDDNSIVKWKKNDNEDWKSAEISDLIKAYEGRPKGEWIDHPHERGSNWEYSMYECSKCHTWQDDDSNYCGNCGADMRKGDTK